MDGLVGWFGHYQSVFLVQIDMIHNTLCVSKFVMWIIQSSGDFCVEKNEQKGIGYFCCLVNTWPNYCNQLRFGSYSSSRIKHNNLSLHTFPVAICVSISIQLFFLKKISQLIVIYFKIFFLLLNRVKIIFFFLVK